MTTRSETASRHNHLFEVSKQVCLELSEGEGLNRTSSRLRSDSNRTGGGWVGFDRSSRAASVHQKSENKLVRQVAATGLSGYLLIQLCNKGSLFNILLLKALYAGNLINRLSAASMLTGDGAFNRHWVKVLNFFSFFHHWLEQCQKMVCSCYSLHGEECSFKDMECYICYSLQNLKTIYPRSYQTAFMQSLISRLITQRDNIWRLIKWWTWQIPICFPH